MLEAGVTIKNADKTGNDEKTVYDLDMGERTAKFKLQPSTIKTNLKMPEVQELTDDDNLKITVKLPKI